MEAVVALPSVSMAQSAQPLLGGTWGEFTDVLCVTASIAHVFALPFRWAKASHTPRALRLEHHISHPPMRQRLLHEIILRYAFLAAAIAKHQFVCIDTATLQPSAAIAHYGIAGQFVPSPMRFSIEVSPQAKEARRTRRTL